MSRLNLIFTMSQSTVIHDLFNVEQYVQLGTELHPTTVADKAESSEHNCHFGLLVLFVIFKFASTLVSQSACACWVLCAGE